jgi:hypothetical protein
MGVKSDIQKNIDFSRDIKVGINGRAGLRSLLLLWVAFTIGTIFSLKFEFGAIRTPDSISYKYATDQIAAHPYISSGSLYGLDNFSITGNSIRPWPINGLFGIFPNDVHIVVFQVLFYGFSWALFTREVMYGPSKRTLVRFALFGACLYLSLPAELVAWNRFILSESISTSLVLTFSAAFVSTASPSSHLLSKTRFLYKHSLKIQILTCFALMLIKPVSGIFLLPLILLSAIWVNTNSTSKKVSQLIATYLVLFSLMITAAIASNSNSSKQWIDKLGMSRESLSVAYLTDHRTTGNIGFVKFMENSGMPTCMATAITSTIDPWFVARSHIDRCPNGVDWVEKNFIRNYSRLLISSDFGIQLLEDVFYQSLEGSNYLLVVGDTAGNNKLIWSVSNWKYTKLKLPLLMVCFLILIYSKVTSGTKIAQESSRYVSALFMLSISGLLAAGLSVLLMPADPGRIALLGAAMFQISASLVIAITFIGLRQNLK